MEPALSCAKVNLHNAGTIITLPLRAIDPDRELLRNAISSEGTMYSTAVRLDQKFRVEAINNQLNKGLGLLRAH